MSDLEDLIELFNIKDKKSTEKYCRNFVLRSEDLSAVILAARLGAMKPYTYTCHFVTTTPEHLHPTKNDIAAIAANGVGRLKPTALKAVTKVNQIFKDRRMFSAHLFYPPSRKYWHLFYFDQRDVEAIGNHWRKGGPHIHYSRESFCREPLDQIWKNICTDNPSPPKAIHIRYDYHHNRPKLQRG